MNKRNLWLDGIMGVVVGDALGVPIEFYRQEKLTEDPVKGMIGYGTYNLPAGIWSDDSIMTLATLDSLRNGYDLKDIMDKFVDWYEKDEKQKKEGISDDEVIRVVHEVSALTHGHLRSKLKIKKNENRLSKSEKRFFYKPQELKKTFFKAVDKKQLVEHKQNN